MARSEIAMTSSCAHFRLVFISLILLLSVESGTSLSLQTPTRKNGKDTIPPPSSEMKTSSSAQSLKPVKRVAIVGAGIAGLSLAHALTNSPTLMRQSKDLNENPICDIEVSIFDSREFLDYTARSGVQLNGGMACLGKINPELQRAVKDAGVPVSYLHGRHKSWSDSKGVDRLWDYSVEKIVKSDNKASEELVDENDNVLWYAIMRGALQETLLHLLPKKQQQIRVQFGKTLTNIQSCHDVKDINTNKGAVCQFSDGSSAGPFDVIVGCDGIKSAVKEYIDRGKISVDASKREGSAAALYSGIRISYAVQEQKEEDFTSTTSQSSNDAKKSTALQQIFADGAYAFSGTFGNGKNRPPCRCFFVTSLDDRYNGPFKRHKEKESREEESLTLTSDASENADWTQNVRKPKEETCEKMMKQIERFGIHDEAAYSIVSNADRFFELGVYFHNPISLSGWSKEVSSSDGSYAVLCGDAAHAMPPFLGQGANQAIQDSYSLAQRIHRYNTEVELYLQQLQEVSNGEPPNLRKVLRQYQNARFFPTASITAKAAILGYLETGGRNGFYSRFRDSFFRFLDFLDVPTKVLLDSATPKV